MNTAERGEGDGFKGENIALNVTNNHWKTIFDGLDKRGDGVIKSRDFVEALKSHNVDVPMHALKRITKKVDANRDSVITFSEFLTFLEVNERKTSARLFSRYIHHTVPPRKLIAMPTDSTDGEYEEEYSCNPPALGMIIVSILEIAAFMYDYYVAGYGHINGPVATELIYNPKRRMEAWRFITYMFVHVGAFHLIVNLAVQILLGVPLEMVHGWWRVLIVYVAGVAAGSLGTSVSDPYVFLAGASGGVYAIIAAHVATIIMNWSEMQYAGYQLLVFLLLATSDIGSAIYSRYVLKQNEQIGYVAHLAGAVAGLLVGIYVLRNLQVHQWERKILYSAVILYVFLMATGIAINVFAVSYFPVQQI